MCGRFVEPSRQQLLRYMVDVPDDWKVNYDTRPTQHAGVVIEHGGDEQLKRMRWGLLVHWEKKVTTSYKTFNARRETVAEKPTFRTAFKRSRCLVPVAGFYEWTGKGDAKQRHYIRADDENDILWLAGLWANNANLGDEPVDSFTIITGPSNEFMTPIHDRMPVVLDWSQREAWFTGSTEEAQQIIDTTPAPSMRRYPVARDLGNRPEQRELAK